jgi:hypothetical protein
MPRLRVHGFSISIDGYGAGPHQDLNNPLGVGGMVLHKWAFGTRTFQKHIGKDGGITGIDDDFIARDSTMSERGSSVETCSDRSEGHGQTTLGRDGGATIRRTTLPFLCSPTTLAHRSK